jgi:HEAT repeat protein
MLHNCSVQNMSLPGRRSRVSLVFCLAVILAGCGQESDDRGSNVSKAKRARSSAQAVESSNKHNSNTRQAATNVQETQGRTRIGVVQDHSTLSNRLSGVSTDNAQRKNQARSGAAGPVSRETASDIVKYLEQSGDTTMTGKRMRDFMLRDDKSVDEAAGLMMTETNEAAILLIANSLAGIGSEKTVGELIKVFWQMPEDSDLKRQVGDVIVGITNTTCAGVLFDALLSNTNGADRGDVAQRALGNMADASIVSEIEQAYGEVQTGEEKQLLADTIRHIQNTNAVKSLIQLADKQDGENSALVLAVCDTLGLIGSPEAATYLFSRLAALPDNTNDPAFAAAKRISNSESLTVVIQAAKGEGNANTTVQLAAISALAGYGGEQAIAVLQEIAQTGNRKVKEAAREALKTRASAVAPGPL